MKRIAAFLICFLATLLAGIAELRPSFAECSAAASCCCCDPVTTAPCFCAEDPEPVPPEWIAPGNPPALSLEFPQAMVPAALAPADLLPRWHPALPWQLPPGERRALLSVWIL